MIHRKKLITILKKNKRKDEIGKNKNNKVRLPKKAPKIIFLMDVFRFKVKFTVNNIRKSIAKFKSATKST